MQARRIILSRIEAFRAQHGFGRNQFGRAAVGDRDFVRDLEKGASISLGKIERAEAFMAAYAQNGAGQVGPADAAEQQGSEGENVVHDGNVSESRAAFSAEGEELSA